MTEASKPYPLRTDDSAEWQRLEDDELKEIGEIIRAIPVEDRPPPVSVHYKKEDYDPQTCVQGEYTLHHYVVAFGTMLMIGPEDPALREALHPDSNSLRYKREVDGRVEWFSNEQIVQVPVPHKR